MGGAVIVMRRVETGESYSGEISIDRFRAGVFKAKEYLDEALRVVAMGVEAPSISLTMSPSISAPGIFSRRRERRSSRKATQWRMSRLWVRPKNWLRGSTLRVSSASVWVT